MKKFNLFAIFVSVASAMVFTPDVAQAQQLNAIVHNQTTQLIIVQDAFGNTTVNTPNPDIAVPLGAAEDPLLQGLTVLRSDQSQNTGPSEPAVSLQQVRINGALVSNPFPTGKGSPSADVKPVGSRSQTTFSGVQN